MEANTPANEAETKTGSAGKYMIPASLGQQRLWFLQELDESWGRAHQVTFAFEIGNSVDVVALQAAVNYLVERHEALRTDIARTEGDVVQIINPQKPVTVRWADVSADPRPSARDKIRQFAAGYSQKLIKFGDSTLFQVAVLDAGNGQLGLLIKSSHIIMDATSLEIFVRELQAAYAAYSKGKVPDLVPPRRQFADYAIWEWQWLTTPDHDSLQDYWTEKLRGCPLVFELPADKRRSATQSFEGALESFELPEPTVSDVKRIAAANGCTVSMVLMTAFATLLSRYMGREDFLIGMPVENRQRPELEDAIGFFTNTLALRMDCRQNPTLEDMLSRIRGTVLEAVEHERFPFSQLVNLLQPERSLSRNPVFQVMYVYKRTSSLQQPGGPLPLKQVRFDPGVSKFDLTFMFIDSGNGIEGVIEYDRNLFERRTAELLVGYFKRSLEALLLTPKRQISEVSLSSAEPRSALADSNSRPSSASRQSDCLIERVEAAAAQYPAAPALHFFSRTLTYEELNGKANSLARILVEKGVGDADRVAVLFDRSPEVHISLLAVLKVGATYVPLDVRHPTARLERILNDVDASIVLTAEDQLGRFPANSNMVPVSETRLGVHEDGNLNHRVPGDVPAYVIHTSGSTGAPKGVVIPRSALNGFVDAMQQLVVLTDKSVLLSLSPATFDIFALEIYLPLVSGARIVLAGYEQSIDGRAIQEIIGKHGVTALQATPSHWRMLIETGWSPPPGFQLLSGGEELPQDLADRLSVDGVEFYNLYGPTETTIWSSCKRLDRNDVVSIGQPLENTATYVLDESFEPTPVNVCGEIFIGGEHLAHGYLNQAAVTAERFVPDPFSQKPGARLYRTGDLGRYLHNGDLQFVGRRDQQVKIRGFRIELGEIEVALRAYPAVRDAIVGSLGENEQQHLVAFVVLDSSDDSEAELNEIQVLSPPLQRHLRKTLPEYMIPTWQVQLAQLPTNDRGKTDRTAILSSKYPRATLTSEYSAPRGGIEATLAQIWAEVLNYDRIGRYDNFFDLGGNSMLTGIVIERVTQKYGVRISLREMFQNATIAYLAQAVREAMKSPEYLAAHGLDSDNAYGTHENLCEELDEVELLSLVSDPNLARALEETV